MPDFVNVIINNFNIFDTSVLIIMIYSVIQCFIKGFSLSFVSFMKWILSLIITIVLLPNLQPVVSDYIESEFINNIGLGVAIFIIIIFILIVTGKALSRVFTWTGLGSIDKTFGLFFGFFKGYVVSVCVFSLLNWFYPYQNWGISAQNASSFDVIETGSRMLIEEFPNNKDFMDTKEKIEKI